MGGQDYLSRVPAEIHFCIASYLDPPSSFALLKCSKHIYSRQNVIAMPNFVAYVETARAPP